MNYEFPLKPPLMADFPACHVCKTPESVGYVANQLVKHHPNRPSHCSVSPGPEGDYPESMRQKCGERLPEFTKEERGRQRGIPIWNGQSYAGWWFGNMNFMFPYIGNNKPNWPNWLSYFSEGWLNHQPVMPYMHWIWKILLKMGETFHMVSGALARPSLWVSRL